MKRVFGTLCLMGLMSILFFPIQAQLSAAEAGSNTEINKMDASTSPNGNKKDEKKETSEEDVFSLDEIVVTTTRTERAIDLIPKPVSVLNRETIESRNTASVLELLDEVPGVSISRGGPIGGQVNIRGFNSNDSRSPLFIDGDRFRGRNTLEYMVLDPSRIKRIEIIRGPAAAMYGTDAMAGLINVITRKATGDVNGPFTLSPRIRSLMYSSESNLRSGSFELGGAGNGFDMLIGLSGNKAEDYQSPEGEVPNSDLTSWSIDLNLGYSPGQDQRIELSAKYTDVTQGHAGGIYTVPGYPYTVRREDPMTEKMVKLHYEGDHVLNLDHLEASLYVRRLYTHMIVDKRPKADPSSSLTRVNLYVDRPIITGGKLFGVYPLGRYNSVTIGSDFYFENSDGSEQTVTKYDGQGNEIAYTPRKKTGIDASQDNIGLFIHDDWDPSEKWTVSAGGRLDYFRSAAEDTVPNYEGSTNTTDYPVTGSLGVIYRPFSILQFTMNSSTTYRAPTSTERFEMSSGFEPNPGLNPEKGITHEVGVRLRLSQASANLTAFLSDYKDLIVRKSVDSTIYPGTTATQRQNVGKARIKGFELDASWRINDRWKTFINASYLRGTDTQTDTPLPYIAPFNGLVGARYTPYSRIYYIEATSKWAARKSRIDEAQERETDAYAVLNLYGGVDLKKLSSSLPDMEMRLAFENILDKAYRNPTTTEDITYDRSVTNPLFEPGRRFSVSLTSKF